MDVAEFKNLTKTYENKPIFADFSLKIGENEKIALMGESGSGKTTLLRIAAGLTAPDSGEFTHSGEIALMFQEPRLLPWKNAIENILAVLQKGTEADAVRYLEAVELAEAAKKYPRELSGGMAQRVALARFFAYAEERQASLLLLDEPTSALDREMAARMMAKLKTFAEGKTAILVTHNEADATAFADRVVKI